MLQNFYSLSDIIIYIKLNYSKGFTLIELLVVISIISLLASIVLTNLNKSKSEANDKAVLQNYLNGRSQMLTKLAPNNNYTTACTEFAQFSTASVTLGGGGVGGASKTCVDILNNWAAEILLPSGGGKYFCLNLDGIAVVTNASSNLSDTSFACDGV